MADFHFVEDYQRHVDDLMAKHPIDEAMSLAVGGGYEFIGGIASDILVYAGAKDGQFFFDFGCGSGRVAHALSKKIDARGLVGTDVIQSLLDYAKTKTPSHYEFLCHRELSIPGEDNTVDFGYAFSVFTHLLQAKCYVYLKDFYRVLKPGGKLVISFLELAEPAHWGVFESSISLEPAPLNTFIERNQWEVWANKLGFNILQFINGAEQISPDGALGQSVLILSKPIW